MGYGHYTREIDGLERHLGYAIICQCDHPGCIEEIDRGLGCLCGDEPGDCAGEVGCGRYFCGNHLVGYRKDHQICGRCKAYRKPWPMKPDLPNVFDDMQWNTPEDEAWAKALSEKSRESRKQQGVA